MKVRYAPRAQADLDAIYSYLDARAPAAALSVKTLIEQRIAAIADFCRKARPRKPGFMRIGYER